MEKEKQQSVVEWYEKEVNALIDKYEAKEISKSDFIVMKHNLFYPAKRMEKEQMIIAYDKGDENGANRIYYHDIRNDVSAEQYYNETFKSE